MCIAIALPCPDEDCATAARSGKASVRVEIEAVLRTGESLSEFVQTAVIEAARRRSAQDAFLARGRASLAQAQQSGEWYAADAVLTQMRAGLKQRLQALGQGQKAAGKKR